MTEGYKDGFYWAGRTQGTDPAMANAQQNVQALLGGSAQTPTPGVFSSIGMNQNLLAMGLAGPTRQNQFTTITGMAGGPKKYLTGVKTSPRLSEQDVLGAMVSDTRQQEAAAGEQRGREDQGFGLAQNALGLATGGMRKTAEGLPGRVEGVAEAAVTGVQGDTSAARSATAALMGTAEKLRSEDTSAADATRRDALDAFQDTTAASIQGQRLAIQSQVKDEIDQVVSQAQQMGLNPSDPQVQRQVQQVRERAADRIGQVVAQTSVEYNANLASLRSNYDSLLTNVRAAGSEGVRAAGQQTVQGYVAAAQIESQMREAMAKEQVTAEQTRAQLLSMADQLDFQGNQWLADWLRDETVYTSPVAPLVATAFALQSSKAAGGTVFAKLGSADWQSQLGVQGGGFNVSSRQTTFGNMNGSGVRKQEQDPRNMGLQRFGGANALWNG